MQRFIDKGNDTITDTKTGLTWTKNTIAVNVDFKGAKKAVVELGEGWRLPTVEELNSLVDRTRYSPAIDTEVFPDTHNDGYWTSEIYACEKSARWVVSFSSGHVLRYHGDRTDWCVRAVRSGQ